jgi:hypothetical protein
MTDLPQWQPMETAPEATEDDPIVLYYPVAGVRTNCISFKGGYGYFLFKGDRSVNFLLEKPLAWMKQKGNTSHE